MKKIFVLTAMAFVLVSSCRKDDASIAAGQANQVSQVASNSQSAVPFSDVFVAHHDGTQLFNPCTNEVMTIYGDVQFRFHGVTNKNNSMTITNSSALGLNAIGESGRKYSITGAGIFQESNYSDGAFTSKVSYTNHFITADGENNFIYGETFYLKVDADGNVSYLRDPVFSVSCQ
jgi:hypothetical protein